MLGSHVQPMCICVRVCLHSCMYIFECADSMCVCVCVCVCCPSVTDCGVLFHLKLFMLPG